MKIGLRWLLAFSFLLLAVHEAHELAHAAAGRLICGEWPVRDFNAWHFAHECGSWWPTAAGPLFSYAAMLLGALLARRGGVALIFAANPFARVFTAAMGGGDEMVVAGRIAGIAERPLALRIAVLTFVTIVCGSAVAFAWRAMRGVARRGLWFTVALLWPMVLTGIALFVAGNRLLRMGVLATPELAGTPLLVVIVSGAAVVLAVATLPWLRPRASARPS